MKLFWLKIGLLIVLSVAGTRSALALDGALVIANPGVRADSLSANVLKDIYTARTKYWDDGQAIILVVLPDQTDAAWTQTSSRPSGSVWLSPVEVQNRKELAVLPPCLRLWLRRRGPWPSCRRTPS